MELNLSQFTGTLHYYQITRNAVLTDGTRYLADKAECYWLMVMIASWLPSVPSDEDFCVARLKVDGSKAYFELTDDIPARRYYALQTVDFTDFPLSEIKLYVERLNHAQFAILLPSEH